MKQQWKQLRHQLERIGIDLLIRIIPQLPRRFVARLARVAGSIAYSLDSRGRRVSLANIDAAFGDHFTPERKQQIARASYREFARTMLDLFWAPALSKDNYKKYMRIEGMDLLRELEQKKESAIVLCIHHGNFEWASLAGAYEGLPGMIVTESFKNEQLGSFFKRCRESAGHKMIEQENSMIRMLKHVKRGGRSGMLVDLNLAPSEASTVINTFGLKLCATLLHAVLAIRGGAKLIPLEGRSQPDGTCLVVLHQPIQIEPGDDYRSVAQKCWDFFEPVIRENPESWMWAYKHWRFKPSRETRSYPFYASENEEFEILLKRIEAEGASRKTENA